MKVFQARFALLLVAAVLAVAAAVSTVNADTFAPTDAPVNVLQQEGDDEHDEEGSGAAEEESNDILPVAIWTTVGIVASGLVLAIFYMFKRRIGGFPENPAWVAPITIMPSSTFPDEGDFGDQVPSHQAHAEH